MLTSTKCTSLFPSNKDHHMLIISNSNLHFFLLLYSIQNLNQGLSSGNQRFHCHWIILFRHYLCICYQCYHLCLNRDWTSSHYLSNLIRKALWSGGKQAFIACIVHGRKNLGHLWWCNLTDNQKACSNIMLWLIVRKAGEQRQASSSKHNHSRPERTETYTSRVTLYNDAGEC